MKSMKEQNEAIINEKLNFAGMFIHKAHTEFRSSTVVLYALRLFAEKKKSECIRSYLIILNSNRDGNN
jgi:hypothetical protein